MTRDLIIVGGGPAGASCARRASKLGLDVLVFEKAVHPRRKACGGGLTLRVSESLDFDISSVIEREQDGLRLHSPSGIMVENHRKEITGHTVRREDFDHLLLKKAQEAGADVIQNTKVTDVIEEASSVSVIVNGERETAKLVVGADGVNSTIARKSGLHERWKDNEIALTFEASVPMDPADILRISGSSEHHEHIFIDIFFGATPLGYAWAFPKRNEYSLGMGAMVSVMSNFKESWGRFVHEFEEKYNVECDLSQQTATRIPLGGLIPNLCSKRIMLAGDAAGFVAPATGEGIHYAVESGIMAAEVAQGIVEGRADVTTASYAKLCKDTIGKDLRIGRFLQKLLFKSTENMERFIRMCEKDEVMKEYSLELVMGYVPFKTSRLRMTKRMLRKHLGQAIRLLI
ncbi:MAG: geranylgeranyl reductase family protein [Candidatus Thorarchaeota archaeon]|nr:geranylgeranyl reductase family protein [Candidatus Thorarchaeota archaeon]